MAFNDIFEYKQILFNLIWEREADLRRHQRTCHFREKEIVDIERSARLFVLDGFEKTLDKNSSVYNLEIDWKLYDVLYEKQVFKNQDYVALIERNIDDRNRNNRRKFQLKYLYHIMDLVDSLIDSGDLGNWESLLPTESTILSFFDSIL